MLSILMTQAADSYSLFADFINNMGFPIAMVAYFIWDKTKVTNQLATAINNNNLVINKLIAVLGHDDLTDTSDHE